MGTNFYWKAVEENDGWRGAHIGKRSAAGLYCWDCDVTLCEGGNHGVHTGRYAMRKTCPKCGAEPVDEGLQAGPVAVELGFAEARDKRPRGVRGCSSFSWAQDPATVRRTCEQNMDAPLVESEYHDVLTGREFLGMLRANCAIEFTELIGQSFS